MADVKYVGSGSVVSFPLRGAIVQDALRNRCPTRSATRTPFVENRQLNEETAGKLNLTVLSRNRWAALSTC